MLLPTVHSPALHGQQRVPISAGHLVGGAKPVKFLEHFVSSKLCWVLAFLGCQRRMDRSSLCKPPLLLFFPTATSTTADDTPSLQREGSLQCYMLEQFSFQADTLDWVLEFGGNLITMTTMIMNAFLNGRLTENVLRWITSPFMMGHVSLSFMVTPNMIAYLKVLALKMYFAYR